MQMEERVAHRKANRRLRVFDKKGNPVSLQRVNIKQTKHEFLFGCGAFDALSYTNATGNEDMTVLEDKVNKWLALYNYGTIPFYWGGALNQRRVNLRPKVE